jgi:hypothetical protein
MMLTKNLDAIDHERVSQITWDLRQAIGVPPGRSTVACLKEYYDALEARRSLVSQSEGPTMTAGGDLLTTE